MSLKAGTYFIKNGDKFIGLADGKRVVLLDGGVEAPKWKVDKEGRDYILKVEDYVTTQADQLVWASKSDEPEPWRIINSERNGKESFVITSPGRPEGWVAPYEDQDPQIIYRILIVGPSYPPFYPPNEVFEFIRVDRD